jgi:hypothetical protein
VPAARRDLAEANLADAARREVDRAIATHALPPTDELIPTVLAILGRWEALTGEGDR